MIDDVIEINSKNQIDAGAKLLDIAFSVANKTDKPKTFMYKFVMAVLCIMIDQENWTKDESIEFLSKLSSNVVTALEAKNEEKHKVTH